MKASLTTRRRKLLSPATARNAALVNQLATPGLGTIMAGRIVTGAGQLLLALAGFLFLGPRVTRLVALIREPILLAFSTASSFDKLSAGLARSDVAIHEWTGLVAYWLTGRSSELFPKPR